MTRLAGRRRHETTLKHRMPVNAVLIIGHPLSMRFAIRGRACLFAMAFQADLDHLQRMSGGVGALASLDVMHTVTGRASWPPDLA